MDWPAVIIRLSPERRRRHKIRNLLHSLLLLGGMVTILGLSALMILGRDGVFWVILGSAMAFVVSPSVPPEWVMRLYGAVPVSRYDLPQLYELITTLSERAELKRAPRLYWIPSRILNAFAVGTPQNAAIGVTDGLLRNLTLRELAGVLAHEISHIRNNDLWIMQLADVMSRATSLLSWFGQLLLLLNVPLLLTGRATFSWHGVLLLIFAPTIMALLQLALSRAREYDADLDAVGLTGDPAGLASALSKLERFQGRFWEEIFLPGRRIPEPSLLRTHPPTEERIRRLLSLYEAQPVPGADPWTLLPERVLLPARFAPVTARPRFRRVGVWY